MTPIYMTKPCEFEKSQVVAKDLTETQLFSNPINIIMKIYGKKNMARRLDEK